MAAPLFRHRLEVRVEDVCVDTEEALVDDLDPLRNLAMPNLIAGRGNKETFFILEWTRSQDSS